MVRNICNSANRDDFLRTLFSNFEFEPIVVINSYWIVTILKSLEIEGVEHKKILDACSSHQRIYTFLVFGHDGCKYNTLFSNSQI